MERGPSHIPTSAFHSTTNSQDSGKARRSVYRLFPIVEPTAPASPVAFQKTTLSKAGSSRRRSSSLENATGEPLSASGHTTLLPATIFGDGRKASLPELRPLRTVQERDSESATPTPTRVLHSAARCQAQDEGAPNRSSSAPEQSANGQDVRLSDTSHQEAHPPPSTNTRLHDSMEFATAQSEDCNFPQVQNMPQRTKPRPNLRIAVFPQTTQDDRPPPPPPKSPRHLRDESVISYQNFTTGPSLSPVSPSTVPSGYPPPPTPSQAQPAVAQKQSFVAVNGDVKVRELTVSPVAARERSQQQQPLKMHAMIPSEYLGERRPSLQPPSSKYATSSRPSTSNGPAPSQVPRTSSLPQKRSLASLRTAALGSWPDEPPKSASRVPSKPQLRLFSASRERFASVVRPASPLLSRKNVSNDTKDEMTSMQLSIFVETSPNPTNSASQTASPATASPQDSIADIIRKHASNQTQNSMSMDHSREQTTLPDPYMLDIYAKRPANAALAAARANVAALRESSSSGGSLGPSDQSRTSGADLGALNRALTAEALSRRSVSPGHVDPVESLKSLSEESEALHARYASLRAERQKISTGIIANMKDQKAGPEYANMLLDEQLSLAAVSSSMDICFAKLKALECRKEDAIAALVTQTTAGKTSPADNISLMIASMARKPSLAPSTNSGSRFGRTGLSTPDMGENRSANRSTASSFSRTASYASEADSQDYRMSGSIRKASLGSEVALHADSFGKQPPETIHEVLKSPKSSRLTQIHEPSENGEQIRQDEDVTHDTQDTHAARRLQSPLARPNVDATHDESRPSSSEDSTPDSLLDQPKRIRVTCGKAAKILGLLAKSADGKESPLIRLPDGHGKDILNDAEVDIEICPTSKLNTKASMESSLISASFYSTIPSDSVTSLDRVDSPALQDLDSQLESFPKPAPSVPPKISPRPVPAPPALPPKSRAGETEQRQMHSRRHDSSMSMASSGRSKRPMSAKSAHTIQVYLDSDQDDILELYRLRSAATVIS